MGILHSPSSVVFLLLNKIKTKTSFDFGTPHGSCLQSFFKTQSVWAFFDWGTRIILQPSHLPCDVRGAIRLPWMIFHVPF